LLHGGRCLAQDGQGCAGPAECASGGSCTAGRCCEAATPSTCAACTAQGGACKACAAGYYLSTAGSTLPMCAACPAYLDVPSSIACQVALVSMCLGNPPPAVCYACAADFIAQRGAPSVSVACAVAARAVFQTGCVYSCVACGAHCDVCALVGTGPGTACEVCAAGYAPMPSGACDIVCGAGSVSDGAGGCAPLGGDGAPCGSNAVCASALCDAGACCNAGGWSGWGFCDPPCAGGARARTRAVRGGGCAPSQAGPCPPCAAAYVRAAVSLAFRSLAPPAFIANGTLAPLLSGCLHAALGAACGCDASGYGVVVEAVGPAPPAPTAPGVPRCLVTFRVEVAAGPAALDAAAAAVTAAVAGWALRSALDASGALRLSNASSPPSLDALAEVIGAGPAAALSVGALVGGGLGGLAFVAHAVMAGQRHCRGAKAAVRVEAYAPVEPADGGGNTVGGTPAAAAEALSGGGVAAAATPGGGGAVLEGA
jgi:hypothetical protein